MNPIYEILRKRFSVTPKIPLHAIAKRAGITTSALSQIESSRIKRPRYDTVLRIQSALEALLAERQSAGKGGAPIAQPPSPTT